MSKAEHFLTLGEASRLTGVAKATLSHNIKKGKMSVVEKTPAGYKIDPAELFRLYPLKPANEQDNRTIMNPVQTPIEQGFDTVQLNRLIEQYEKRIDELTRSLDREKENSDYFKRQLDRTTLLLEHRKADEQEKPATRGFLKLFRTAS